MSSAQLTAGVNKISGPAWIRGLRSQLDDLVEKRIQSFETFFNDFISKTKTTSCGDSMSATTVDPPPTVKRQRGRPARKTNILPPSAFQLTTALIPETTVAAHVENVPINNFTKINAESNEEVQAPSMTNGLQVVSEAPSFVPPLRRRRGRAKNRLSTATLVMTSQTSSIPPSDALSAAPALADERSIAQETIPAQPVLEEKIKSDCATPYVSISPVKLEIPTTATKRRGRPKKQTDILSTPATNAAPMNLASSDKKTPTKLVGISSDDFDQPATVTKRKNTTVGVQLAKPTLPELPSEQIICIVPPSTVKRKRIRVGTATGTVAGKQKADVESAGRSPIGTSPTQKPNLVIVAPPMTPVTKLGTSGVLKSITKRSGAIKRRLKESATKASTPKVVLSSFDSPLKTPLPAGSSRIILKLPEPHAPTPLATADKMITEEKKIEAWTSRFIKTTSFGVPPMAATREGRKSISPVKNSSATTATETPAPIQAVKKSEPIFEYIESPLTKARRIDTQNLWREKQLKNYMASKGESLKNAMSMLRETGLIPASSFVSSTLAVSGTTITNLASSSGPPVATASSLIENASGPIFTGDNVAPMGTSQSHSESALPTATTGMAMATLGKDDENIFVFDGPAMDTIHTEPLDIEPTFTSSPLPPPNASLDTILEPGPSRDSHPSSLVSKSRLSVKSLTAEDISILAEDIPEQMNQLDIFDIEGHLPPPSGMAAANNKPDPTMATSMVGISTGTAKSKAVDQVELETRRRLKERNERALEKRKQLLSKTIGKAPTSLSAMPVPPPAPTKSAGAPSRKMGSTRTSATNLQKQVLVNNAMKSIVENVPITTVTHSVVIADKITSVNTVTTGNGLASPPRQGVLGKEGDVFKKPLPMTKTPVKSTNAPMASPSSDDTFTTAAATMVNNSAPIPPSPKLPEINSESSEDDDRENKRTGKNRIKPLWAATPEIAKCLHQQKSMRPESIFGDVQPVKLEDFFKDTGKKYNRGRNSSIFQS